MKLSFFQKYRPDPELLALKEELQEAQWELTLAYRQFNLAVDPELVESCVYHINAVKARCNYLIRAIKEREPELLAAERGTAKNRQSGFGGKRTRSKRSAVLPAPQTAGGKLPPEGTNRCSEAYGAYQDEGDAVWT